MISVCIPTYNGEKYIGEQLISILNQLTFEDEVIISDDSSTDLTIDIIRSFNDPRIKLLTNQTFGSPIYNLENALKHAKGGLIFLADQDDVWAENKVKSMLPYFNNYDVVISDCIIVDSNLNMIHSSFFEIYGSKKGIFKNLIKNTYLGCCMAFKRTLLNYALPFPTKLPMHDIWLGFIADLYMKPHFISEKLIFYRRHDNNKSSTSESSPYSILKKIGFRWHIIKHLPRLLLKSKTK